MTVSLGPIGKILTDIPPNPRTDGFGANPRCLRRDVNRYASSMLYANYTYALIKDAKDIDTFQKNMLGMPEKNDWGVHMAGHYTIGGDPGGVCLESVSTELNSHLHNIGFLLFSRGPHLLVPSRHGRPDLVDLADARPRKPHEHAAGESAERRLY